MARKRSPARVRPAPPPLRSGRRHGLLILLGAALVLKLLVLASLNNHPLLQPAGGLDTAYYVDLAREIAGGRNAPVGQAFFVSPLYVYFLAAVFALTGGSLVAAKLVQILLGVAAVWLIWRMALEWFGARAAWIGGALAVGTGVFTFFEVVLLQAAIDPFLAALALYAVTRAWTRPGAGTFLASGVALGLFALNRPNVLPYAVLLLALLPFARPARPGREGDRRARAVAWGRDAAAFACGLLLVVGPVAARNYAASGEAVAIASHGGLNFYIGNNAEADGAYHNVPGITPSIVGQAQDAERVVARAVGHAVGPSEVSDYFYGEAWAWMRAHPGDAIGLFGRKLAYVFNHAWLTLNFSFPYYQRDASRVLGLLVIGPWLLIPLGLIGLFAPRRPGVAAPHSPSLPNPSLRSYLPWALFVPVYAVSVAIFFVSGRYRMPLLVPWTVTAGAAADWLWRLAASPSRRRTLVVPAAALGLLAVAANWDFGLDNGIASERSKMIMHYVDTRQDDRAMALLARTETGYPNPSLLLFRVGKGFLDRGDAAKALPILERAHALEPARAEIRLPLGEALRDVGRPVEAIPHLRAALAAGVRPDLAAFDLARALAATGARDEAVTALRSIPSPEQLDPASQAAVGRFALELRDPGLAVRFLTAAVQKTPGDAAARESLGLALGLLGRGAEAVAAFEAAARLDGNNAEIRLNLAVAYATNGRLDEARREALAALTLRPGYDRARQFLEALDRVR